MMNSLLKLTLTMSLLAATPALAATQIGPYLQVSGFGTLGAAQSDDGEVEYIHSGQAGGIRDRLDFQLDSNLGLQATVQPASWISATIQLLAMHRIEPNITVETEWAFVKLAPLDHLELRAGRMLLPTFAVSDFRDVKYANTWARSPDEVYGLALLRRLEGVDATYALPIGSSTLSLTVLGGKSFVEGEGVHIAVTNVKGANVQWERDGIALRIGRVTGDVNLPELNVMDVYTFSGVGVNIDRNRMVLQAEYVMRRSKQMFELVDANGWYVLGGYRFGKVLPYAMYSDTKPAYPASPMSISGSQSTTALGVRWDAFQSAAFKLQIQHVNAHNTQGISFDGLLISSNPVPNKRSLESAVNVMSLNVDFVF